MCQTLSVSDSGFYDSQKRSKSLRLMKKEKLQKKISELFFIRHKQMAGSPTITEDLYEFEEFKSVHRSRVAEIMKEMDLKCKIQKNFVITTDSRHDKWVCDNLLNRQFSPERPNEKLAGDITYIKAGSKWVYLTIFMDLYSRKIVGWDLSEELTADSTCHAFKKYL